MEGGLNDLSLSRTSLSWGIPVPDGPGHVIYVWYDALTNYITGLGYPDGGERFHAFWPADIAVGVDAAGNKDEGAGDQGIMFGSYAHI